MMAIGNCLRLSWDRGVGEFSIDFGIETTKLSIRFVRISDLSEAWVEMMESISEADKGAREFGMGTVMVPEV
jgi:hypothetical protein